MKNIFWQNSLTKALFYFNTSKTHEINASRTTTRGGDTCYYIESTENDKIEKKTQTHKKSVHEFYPPPPPPPKKKKKIANLIDAFRFYSI